MAFQWKGTLAEVARAFADKEVNIYGDVSWRVQTLYFDDERRLDSDYFPWGRPVAFRLLGDDPDDLIIINGQDVSNVPRNHQMTALSAVPDHRVVVLPLDLLAAAGIDWHELRRENIIDFAANRHTNAIYDRDMGTYYHAEPNWKQVDGHYTRFFSLLEDKIDTRQGAFAVMEDVTVDPELDDLRFVAGYWHTMQSSTITYNGNYFYIGTDEGRYFMTQLPRPVVSNNDALIALQPEPVQMALAAGIPVKRQGEFFAVPTTLDTSDVMQRLGYEYVTHFQKATRVRSLPQTDADSDNVHDATIPVLPDGTFPNPIMATGTMYHRHARGWRAGISTGEHRSLDLRDGWYEIYVNAAVRSWSIGGNAD